MKRLFSSVREITCDESGYAMEEALMMGILGFGLIGWASLFAVDLLAPVSSMEKTGSVIEEWAVANPSEALPATNGYILYNELETDKYDILPHDLQEDIPGYAKFNQIWVKISPSADRKFSICTYQGDEGAKSAENIVSYDSVTGEEAVNEAEVCA